MVHKLLVESIWTSTRRHLLSACVIAMTSLCAGTASASTINVNTTGPSSPTRCNLTDAIRAATTNTRVNGCAAGQPAPTIDTIQLQAGDRLVLETPGGGGYGDPAQREEAARSRDLRNEYVTA